MTTAMTFGERLKELREAAGLSQEALARAAGLSTSTVAKTEQRDIDPSWSTVQALAKALGVSSEDFREGAPPPKKKKGK
jgi:transcriptional regulator with XRE-family HTH domain